MLLIPKHLQSPSISKRISVYELFILFCRAQSFISLKISKFALIHGLECLKILDLEHSLKILHTKVTTYLSLSDVKPSTNSYLISSSRASNGLLLATVNIPRKVPRVPRYYLTKLGAFYGL